MPMQRAWAVCLKEFQHSSGPRILLLVVLSPAIMLVAFGYLFSFEVKGLHLAVLDYDRTPVSRAFVASLLSDGELDLAGAPSGWRGDRRPHSRGSVDIALVIPPGLETGLQRGDQVLVQAIVDGSDPVAASQNMANLAARTAAFAVWSTGWRFYLILPTTFKELTSFPNNLPGLFGKTFKSGDY